MRIKLDEGAYLPLRAHDTDAGLDLLTPRDVIVPETKMVDVHRDILSDRIEYVNGVALGSATIDTLVHVELPHGFYGKIEGKSSLNVKRGIVSLGGVIDEGYTGSIVVKLYNTTGTPYQFHAGEKIAQLVIQPYIAPDLEVVDELTETERGSNGFGSTGK